jgi:hypothetical protein
MHGFLTGGKGKPNYPKRERRNQVPTARANVTKTALFGSGTLAVAIAGE